jgi:ketosteroid isomerase-like protein
MSEADIETLRSRYEAFSRGDWDPAFRAAHPDLEFKDSRPRDQPWDLSRPQ